MACSLIGIKHGVAWAAAEVWYVSLVSQHFWNSGLAVRPLRSGVAFAWTTPDIWASDIE
jgi:hypothetical protein